jgi:CLIP-associating protein 1/2
MSQIASPTIILERAGNYAWAHKSWRVREEFVLTVATAVGLFASTELLMQRVLLSPVSLGIKMIHFSHTTFVDISGFH